MVFKENESKVNPLCRAVTNGLLFVVASGIVGELVIPPGDRDRNVGLVSTLMPDTRPDPIQVHGSENENSPVESSLAVGMFASGSAATNTSARLMATLPNWYRK